MAHPVTSETSSQLVAARNALQTGRYSDAKSLALAGLERQPDDPDCLYMAAVAARYLGDLDDALERVRHLKRVQPDHGRAYQEEGHVRRAQGHAGEAILAYRMAVRCNPALVASWRAMAEINAASGNDAEARAASAQADRLAALPKPLLAATNHIHETRVLKAEEILRAFLTKHPHHVEAMRLLADVGSRLGVLADADFLLESAIELEPDNLQLRIDHIQVLRKRQKFAAALESADQLLSRDPDNPVFQSLYAIESLQSGQYDVAIAMFDRVLDRQPNDPATLTSKGHALKTCGREDEAIEAYRAAIAAAPGHGDAWYALANLKTYRFSAQELADLRSAADFPDVTAAARVHLAFALGKALEDQGDHDGAFASYARGNALKQRQVRYTTAHMLEEVEAQKRHCQSVLFRTRGGQGCPAPDPIFIVGLPRAGSTLIEQILASHSQVDGTLELPNVLSLAHRLRGRNLVSDRDRYPRILSELTADQLGALGEEYIETTRIHRQGGAYFTDKMPNNFRHLGLIHLILPNAKIIDARRAPLDCCWSGFKQLFAEGQEFTYGLEEIGHYYRAYVELMDHWNAVLPEGTVLTVQHEDVLDDLEGQVHRILAYCGLPFEAACLDFHTTERAVRTASSAQVRQPLNRSGQGQWKPFEAHLGPLKRALGPALLEPRG